MKKYNIIYADPPWKYNDKGCRGNATNHYPTMKNEDICNLPIEDLADDNCVLFLWVTAPKLPEGLQVMESWGFKYKTCIIWAFRLWQDYVCTPAGIWYSRLVKNRCN